MAAEHSTAQPPPTSGPEGSPTSGPEGRFYQRPYKHPNPFDEQGAGLGPVLGPKPNANGCRSRCRSRGRDQENKTRFPINRHNTTRRWPACRRRKEARVGVLVWPLILRSHRMDPTVRLGSSKTPLDTGLSTDPPPPSIKQEKTAENSGTL